MLAHVQRVQVLLAGVTWRREGGEEEKWRDGGEEEERPKATRLLLL